jgi:hypothetical protein
VYGQKRLNPHIEKTRAEQSETIFAKQEIQRGLRKMTSVLEQLDESQEDSAEGQRKQTKIAGEINEFLNLISPEARGEVFRENEFETI